MQDMAQKQQKNKWYHHKQVHWKLHMTLNHQTQG